MNMEELEVAVGALTSRMSAIDAAFKKSKMNIESTMVFRCAASGLFYPDDYVKQWGRKYGIGLGPTVCSESLQTDYETNPPNIDNTIKKVDQIMHPVYNIKCQMDWHVVEVAEAKTNMAILEQEDQDIFERGIVLLGKQLKNKRNRIHILHAEFNRLRNKTTSEGKAVNNATPNY